MLVSHRDMISVYKMTQNDGQWQTQVLDGGTIRNMFIKRKSKEAIQAQIR